jgi:hypothetical protein
MEGKANLLRLRQEIPMQEAELAAIDDGIAALVSLANRLIDTHACRVNATAVAGR